MTYAVSDFVESKLGRRYIESVPIQLAEIFEETTATTPLFFVLSPGVDPLKARVLFIYLLFVGLRYTQCVPFVVSARAFSPPFTASCFFGFTASC